MIHPSLCIYIYARNMHAYINVYTERVENAWLWVKYISTQWSPLCNETLPRTQPISILSGWPSFFVVPQILQNMGHLGSRYIYIYFYFCLNHGTKNTLDHRQNPFSGTLGSQLWCLFCCNLKGWNISTFKTRLQHTSIGWRRGGSGFCWPEKTEQKPPFHEFTNWMTSWLCNCRIHSSKSIKKAGKSPSSDWNIYLQKANFPSSHVSLAEDQRVCVGLNSLTIGGGFICFFIVHP